MFHDDHYTQDIGVLALGTSSLTNSLGLSGKKDLNVTFEILSSHLN